MATNRFSDIKHTYEALEKNLRQLESQEENIDQQRMLVQQILSKLPTEVIVKLEESKNLDENGTVKLLRESLKRYINIRAPYMKTLKDMSIILEVQLTEVRVGGIIMRDPLWIHKLINL